MLLCKTCNESVKTPQLVHAPFPPNMSLFSSDMFTCVNHHYQKGAGKWLNADSCMFVWSVIGRLMVHTSPLPFALTVLTIHLLSEYH